MNRQLCLAVSFVLAHGAALARQDPAVASPSKPKFQVPLTREEFTALHSAAESGVTRYGGTAEFRVTIGKGGGQTMWALTTDDPKLMEVWEFWLAEKTAEVVAAIDFDRIDDPSRLALKTIQSTRAHFLKARAAPTWDTTSFEGDVSNTAGRLEVQTVTGPLSLSASSTADLRPFIGRRVVVFGMHKAANELEATRVVEFRRGVLELAVMSHCPFAKKAEAAIIQKLRKASTSDNLRLEVRYIFLKSSDPIAPYFSPHGEPETTENLVQMTLRDNFDAAIFHDYLLARAESDSSWQDLARRVGLNSDTVAFIQETITRDARKMMADEFAALTSSSGDTDRSPTLIWQGRIVPNLAPISSLAGLDWSGGSCEGKPR